MKSNMARDIDRYQGMTAQQRTRKELEFRHQRESANHHLSALRKAERNLKRVSRKTIKSPVISGVCNENDR